MQLTARQIVDESLAYVRKHGRSITTDGGGTTCMYRGPDGKRCFVGVFIKDSEYKTEFENKTADKLPLCGSSLLRDDVCHMPQRFWVQLQAVHDTDSYWIGDEPTLKCLDQLDEIATAYTKE